MFGYPAVFINGNMFTGLHQDNMVLRLSMDDRERFLQQKGAKVFEPMPGRIMREYVVVPEQLRKPGKKLFSWLEKSHKYASSLPPKTK